MMDAETKIRMAMSKAGIGMNDLAKAFGTSPTNMSTRMRRRTMRERDMQTAADAVGAVYHSYFEWPDGTRVGE